MTQQGFLIEDIAARALKGKGCTRDEAHFLASESVSLEELMTHATRIREHFFGNRVQFCAIVNARSGACRENCAYCAQSVHHTTGVAIYPLQSATALLEAAAHLRDSGASTFSIVTSGPSVTGDELHSIENAVRDMKPTSGMKPCASLGKLDVEALTTLQQAGLTRYHHNLETSRAFYPQICGTHSWDERVETVRAAQEAGLEVCCGGLFGLGESWDDRIDLALTLRELEIRSVPVNFLNPVPGTPLGDRAPLSPDEALRLLAVFRFILPHATLRVCGGRPLVLGDRQDELFRAGANALMTGDYLTTAGITPDTDQAMLERLGLVLE